MTVHFTIVDAREVHANGEGTPRLLLLDCHYQSHDPDGEFTNNKQITLPMIYGPATGDRPDLIGKTVSITLHV